MRRELPCRGDGASVGRAEYQEQGPRLTFTCTLPGGVGLCKLWLVRGEPGCWAPRPRKRGISPPPHLQPHAVGGTGVYPPQRVEVTGLGHSGTGTRQRSRTDPGPGGRWTGRPGALRPAAAADVLPGGWQWRPWPGGWNSATAGGRGPLSGGAAVLPGQGDRRGPQDTGAPLFGRTEIPAFRPDCKGWEGFCVDRPGRDATISCAPNGNENHGFRPRNRRARTE